MKKFKKNHFITPALIALTGLLTGLSSYLIFRPQKPPINPTELTIHNTKPEQLYKKFCEKRTFENKAYWVCTANPQDDDIELFLNDENDQPYKHFQTLEKKLNNHNKTLAFAMNAGMYHKDYSAVGLYIENGKEYYRLSTKDGFGNFHMKPNGVFYIKGKRAAILATQAFLSAKINPDLATQSGPMLVINNQIHPRFIPNSPYLEYRNGVGVRNDGRVVFVISATKVNFDEMARFFRDELKTPNALFFDGSISSLYAPEINRYDWWYSLGPIIGVVVDKEK